jgi:periplasmic protein TonB
MTEGGFYQSGRMNPRAVAIVVLLHGAALAALLLAKGDLIQRIKDPPLIVDPVPVPPPPPPHPVPPPPTNTRPQDPQPTVPPTIFHPPIGHPIDITTFPPPPPGPVALNTTTFPPPPPPPPPPPKFEAARARANLGSYVSNADYPDTAIRNEEQGTTRFRLLVGPDGRVTDCAVTGSSGSSALDAATCRLMKARARFTPARDSSGNPTSDSVASTIRWVLPDG